MGNMNEPIITRFAPSPTGTLHLGGARTALFCYLFARRHNGKFILRIEDTDKERSKQEHTDEILAALEWLGLQWDGEPEYQSRRIDLYEQAAHKLLERNLAYRCTCTVDELDTMREEQKQRGENPKYDGRHRESNLGEDTQKFVIRFKNPLDGDVNFTDLVQGEVKVSNSELDDMVIIRADGSPTYNFCAVVDDMDMGITHIIRGDDHLRNSLRQCNLYDAFGVKRPHFAHLPLILNAKGGRLSKREGSYNILDYKARGILPQSLCSYMARLGWSHGDQEIFTMKELTELFDLAAVQKSPAQYDETKMLWVNRDYIMSQSNPELAPVMFPMLRAKLPQEMADKPSNLEAIIGLHKERCDDLNTLADEIIFYYEAPEYAKEEATRIITAENLPAVKQLRAKLDLLELTDWDALAIKSIIKELLAQDAKLKFPDIAMPLRLAITGTTSSASIDKVAELLGKEETLKRLDLLLEEKL